jgi:hypothetical protein
LHVIHIWCFDSYSFVFVVNTLSLINPSPTWHWNRSCCAVFLRFFDSNSNNYTNNHSYNDNNR